MTIFAFSEALLFV